MAHGPISQEVILAKIETVYGTDSVPAVGTNSILVRKVDYGLDKLRMADRASVRASLGTQQQIYGGSMRQVSFEVEVKGSGAAGTAPEIGPLLRACGMGETIVASTSVTYAPASSSIPSLTFYFFESVGGASVRHIITGARGTVSFRIKAGDIVVANFNFMGKFGTSTDIATPVPVYNTTVPVAVKGLATTLGGVSTLVMQDYEFSVNNNIETPDSVTDTEGFGNTTILKRDPQIVVNLHAEPVSVINHWSQISAGTSLAFASGTLGATPGNRFALNAGQTHVRNITHGDSNGFRGRGVTLGCHETSTADTDYSAVFT